MNGSLLFNNVIASFHRKVAGGKGPCNVVGVRSFANDNRVTLFNGSCISCDGFNGHNVCLLVGTHIRSHCGSNHLDLSVKTVRLLRRRGSHLVRGVDVAIPVRSLSRPAVGRLSALVGGGPNRDLLCFGIISYRRGIVRGFFSRGVQLGIAHGLIRFLRAGRGVSFGVGK